MSDGSQGRSRYHLVMIYLTPAVTGMPWWIEWRLGSPIASRLFQASRLPRRGVDLDAGILEEGLAAAFGVVQEDHRRPGALAAGPLHLRPIGLGRVEEIVVRLELLADRVALALDGLALVRIDADQGGDLRLDQLDDRLVGIEVAALAGAEFGIVVGESSCEGTRSASISPISRSHSDCAEEIADDEDVEIVARNRERAGRGEKPIPDLAADADLVIAHRPHPAQAASMRQPARR